MNWNNIQVYILYSIILTVLTSTIWTCIWELVCLALKKKGNVKLIYRLLKWTMLGYICPFLFVGQRIYYALSYHTDGYIWLVTPEMTRVAWIVNTIWLVGVIITSVRYMAKYLELAGMCRCRIIEIGVCSTTLKECIERLKIKRCIRVYSSYSIRAPFIFGWWSPSIYLPQKEYSKEDITNILTHELMHLKQGDVFLKPFFRMICCLLWFHPLVWLIAKQFRDWAEVNCDVRCCEKYCKQQSYYSSIYNAVEFNVKNVGVFAPSWCEGENEIKWRITTMKKDSKQKQRLGISGVILTAVLLVSTVTTYATEIGVNHLYNKMVEQTLDENEETLAEDDLIEYSVDMSEFDGILIVGESSFGMAPNAVNGSISNWAIPKNTIRKTGGFYKAKDATIEVAVIASPNNKSIRVGVFQPNGTADYVVGSGAISHTFRAKASGTVYVFVNNTSDVTVTVNGVYQ